MSDKKCPECGGLPGLYPRNTCPVCWVKDSHEQVNDTTTIRSVLEGIYLKGKQDEWAGFQNSPEAIDNALQSIQSIIEEAKPEAPIRYENMDVKTDYHKRGYTLGINQYELNLRELLK